IRIKSIGYIAIGLFLVNSACGVNKKSSDKSTVVPIPQEIDGVLNTIDTTTNLIKGKLSNGLTYYVQSNPYPAGETIYRLFLKTGSVAETEAQKGLAHFVEHLAFNGTINFPGDSLVRFLEQRGAKFGKDLNAHTSYNETVYKLQLPSKDTVLVDHTLQILADWLGGLRL